MAWNEPGKPDQDPWGSGSDPKRPEKNTNNPNKPKSGGNNEPDLDALLEKAQSLFGGKKGGSGSGGSSSGFNGGDFINKAGLSVILLIAVVVWLLSGIYIVDPAERGVVLRFGAYQTETSAGPHWHLPYPIETVKIVNVDQIRTAEIGYNAGSRNRSKSLSESLMLTKDENIVDIEIAAQYKVQSANQYLFSVEDPDLTLRAIVESALREVVGKNTMDFVLTEGRNEVVSQVKELAQSKLDQYKTGLVITSVNLQDAQPPEQVQAAFADVVKAREDRERLINEAEAYANGVIPVARGQAARELEEASAYHDQVIARAQGESSRFTSIVAEYKKAPEIMRERLYIDAITNVLSTTSKVLVGTESGNNLLYLPLDKMMGNQTTVPFTAPAIAPDSSKPTEPKMTRQSTQGQTKPQQRSNIREFLRSRELR